MARKKKEPDEITVQVGDKSYTYKCKYHQGKPIEKKNKDGKVTKYNSWAYYTVSVPTGELYKNGRIKYQQIRAHSQSELYDKTKEFLTGLYHSAPDKALVKDDIKKWMVKEKLNELKPTSYDSLEFVIDMYIIPYIGEYIVSEVTTEQLQDVIDEVTNQGLSRSIISKVKTFLTEYFKDRKKVNTIVDLEELKMPSTSKIKEIREDLGRNRDKKMFLEPEQVKAIQDVIYNGYDPVGYTRDLRPEEERRKDKNHPVRNTYSMPHQTFEQGIIFDFMFQTGLRASEMCALKFSDWDSKRQTIDISKNRTVAYKRDKNGNKTEKAVRDRTPKTDNSSSIITLSKKANSLMQMMYDADEFKNYVAHTKDGSPITKNELRGRWHRILRAAKVETERTPSGRYKEEYGLHTIRHTYASLLYQKYHDMSLVSKKLRHSDPSFTAKIYVSIMRTYEDIVDEEFEV